MKRTKHTRRVKATPPNIEGRRTFRFGAPEEDEFLEDEEDAGAVVDELEGVAGGLSVEYLVGIIS
jgi:hypothetical protein